jgi:hypothetical protein
MRAGCCRQNVFCAKRKKKIVAVRQETLRAGKPCFAKVKLSKTGVGGNQAINPTEIGGFYFKNIGKEVTQGEKDKGFFLTQSARNNF